MKGRLPIIWGLACLVGLALPGAAWSAGAPGHAKPEMPPALTMPGQTSAPGETTAPGETSEPGETSAPEEPGAAGETSAPGKTGAPGRTGAPGQTSAPGRTTAAGQPGAPEAPGFAGKPGHATPGAGRAPLAPALVPLMQHIQALERGEPWALKRLLTPPPTTSPELTPLLGGDLGLGPAAGLGRLAAQVGSLAHVPTASVQTSALIPCGGALPAGPAQVLKPPLAWPLDLKTMTQEDAPPLKPGPLGYSALETGPTWSWTMERVGPATPGLEQWATPSGKGGGR